MRKIKNPKVGEYVLLTKYSDKDPYDPWFVGFFTRKIENQHGICYKAEDNENHEYFYNKFRHCFRISEEEGRLWVTLYGKTT